MGPRMGIRGKETRDAKTRTDSSVLQWGRGWGSAERDELLLDNAEGVQLASMGPRMGIRGKDAAVQKGR